MPQRIAIRVTFKVMWSILVDLTCFLHCIICFEYWLFFFYNRLSDQMAFVPCNAVLHVPCHFAHPPQCGRRRGRRRPTPGAAHEGRLQGLRGGDHAQDQAGEPRHAAVAAEAHAAQGVDQVAAESAQPEDHGLQRAEGQLMSAIRGGPEGDYVLGSVFVARRDML